MSVLNDSSTMQDASRTAIDRIWPAGSAPDRNELISAVTELLSSHVTAERLRCVEICRNRAALWRRTPLARAEVPYAREEARGRANEASYLADLIESGQRVGSDEESETPN